MNLTEVPVSPGEAGEKLAEYRAVPAAERTAEDEALAAAYGAAARGLPLISLPRTIAAGGFFENGLPRLAVIRADAAQCFAWWDGSDLVFADRDDRMANRGALVGMHSVRVNVAGDELPSARPRWNRGSTVVPLVPPRHRQHRRLSCSRCHVLWEVEEWSPAPPRDPALLRHVRGDLWAVLATWDLTELERLVLSQRVAGPR